MKPETIEKLREFIDELETEYGNLVGFEVNLEHPLDGGQRQDYANIKEFIIKYVHQTEIDIK